MHEVAFGQASLKKTLKEARSPLSRNDIRRWTSDISELSVPKAHQIYHRSTRCLSILDDNVRNCFVLNGGTHRHDRKSGFSHGSPATCRHAAAHDDNAVKPTGEGEHETKRPLPLPTHRV